MADPLETRAMAESGRVSESVPSEDSPPATLRMLSGAWGRLGGSPLGRAILGLARVRALGRAWARAAVVEKVRALPHDVTVLIGVRNRTDRRIVNALRSIGGQVYPPGRVEILVVDYGSDVAEARRLEGICARFGARTIRVDGVARWSRGRCLNIGLRQVRTRYVMTSDSDILLSPHYLADAVEALRADPLAVVGSEMLDLPRTSADTMEATGTGSGPLDLAAWRGRTVPRLGMDLHPSITVTLTALHHAVRGYDEFYEGWGREDDDLMRRFAALGLRPRRLAERSFYLHQWHPKFEGLADGDPARAVARNDAHFTRSHSILRNDADWGRRTATDG